MASICNRVCIMYPDTNDDNKDKIVKETEKSVYFCCVLCFFLLGGIICMTKHIYTIQHKFILW